MRRLLLVLVSFLFSAVLLASMFKHPPGARGAVIPFIQLEPATSRGIISREVGQAKIWVTDQDNDGQDELISCSSGSAFILEYISGKYQQKWFSPMVDCALVAVGDLNGDHRQEILVAQDQLELIAFDGATYELITRFPNPDSTNWITDLLIANVDSDPQNEIIVLNPYNAVILNGQTFEPEWHAAGKGGMQAAVGDIDNDPAVELVINSNPAHVLDVDQQAEEWSYDGGFGWIFDLAEIDNDGKDEILGATGSTSSDSMIRAFDALPMQLKWEIGPFDQLQALAGLDLDRDGLDELVLGQRDTISAYHELDGALLWTIANPQDGVYGLAAGDLDDDNTQEVFWGSGEWLLPDGLNVGDWTTQSIEWTSPDMDAPLLVAAGDIDQDGEVEIVSASRSSNNGEQGGYIEVYDSRTALLEWSRSVSLTQFDIYHLALGQVDLDPALEIIVSGKDPSYSRILVIDGQSQTTQWQSPVLGGGQPVQMLVADLEVDGIDEIFIALTNNVIFVFDVVRGANEWSLRGFDEIADIAVGDPNQNSTLDLAVLTTSSLQVFESGTDQKILDREVENGHKLAITRAAPQESSAYLIASGYGYEVTTISAFSGINFAPKWERSLQSLGGDYLASSLQTRDLNGDGLDEFILTGGSINLYGGPSSLLYIGSSSYLPAGDYYLQENLGEITNAAAADLDGDNEIELVFATWSYWRANELIFTDRHTIFTPAVLNKSCYFQHFDDFTDPGSGWPIYDDGEVQLAYHPYEHYLVDINIPGEWVGVQVAQSYLDMIFTVDASLIGSNPGVYGVIFAISPAGDQFYLLDIADNGDYWLWRFLPGAAPEVVTSGNSDAIQPANSWNTIKITRSGVLYKVYVNDHMLASISDDRFSGPGQVGLSVTSSNLGGISVFFDNFSVWFDACQLASQSQNPRQSIPLSTDWTRISSSRR